MHWRAGMECDNGRSGIRKAEQPRFGLVDVIRQGRMGITREKSLIERPRFRQAVPLYKQRRGSERAGSAEGFRIDR